MNIPLFCKPYKNEIWAMLLEKGWAKVKGGYTSIDNGSPSDILDSLLLSSTIGDDIINKLYFINDTNKYEVWENIVDKFNNNKNVMMICLSKDKISNKKKLNNFFYSIVENHYYTIEDIVKNTDKERILKLRNPWGFNLKNENYNTKKDNFDFIITENDNEDDDDNNDEEENEHLLSGGEFLIDYKYFCYLFQEIQIYEINNFSFSYIINNKDNQLLNRLNVIYINVDKIQNEEVELTVNIENIKEYKKTKDISPENNYINLSFIIIDINNISIIKKINQKLFLSNQDSDNSFPLFINKKLSKEYYFCLLFTSSNELINNNKNKNNLELHINFKTKEYLDIINNIKYIPNEEIYNLIRTEFEPYNIDLEHIINEEIILFKNIDDIQCNQKYLEEKYPKDMNLLLEMEPMKNKKEKIIFRDKYYFKNNNYYLGEQIYNGNIRHGRGIYYLNKNGNKYIGYNEYGKFVGKGKVIDKDGNIKEGEFINGKLKLD